MTINRAAPPTTFTVSATGTVTFTELTEGYTPADTDAIKQSITLTKQGDGAITGLNVGISGGVNTNFLVGTVNPGSLGAGTQSTSFYIRPKFGLTPGTYTETVTITADGQSSHTFDVSFKVNASPTTFTVSATGTVTFAELTVGYTTTNTDAIKQSITLTKQGSGAITGLSVSISGGASTNFLVGTVNPGSLGAGTQSTSFYIRPKLGLAPGTYTETVTITADGQSSHSFDVSFKVNAATMNVSSVKVTTFNATQTPSTATIEVAMDDIGLNAGAFAISNDTTTYSAVTVNNAAYSDGKYILSVSGMTFYDSYTLTITKTGYDTYTNSSFYGTLAAADDLDFVHELNIFPTFSRELTSPGIVTISNSTYAANQRLYSGSVYAAIDGNNGHPDNGMATRLIGIFAKAPEKAKGVKTLRTDGTMQKVLEDSLIDSNPNYQETVASGKAANDNDYWKTIAFVPLYSQIASARQEDNSRILEDPADRFRIIEWYNNEDCTGAPIKVIRLMVKVEYTGTLLSGDAGLTSILGQAVTAGSEAGTIGAPKTATVSVANGVETVSAEDIAKSDAGATVTFYGTNSNFDTPEAGDVNLTPGGATYVYIKVAAANGKTLYYKVTINRAAPSASQPGVLAFSNAAYTVGEDGGSVTITVTRTGGSDGAVSVDYATSNGTATAGSDYTAASGTLSFADGDAADKTFTINISQDAILEGNETVSLTLSNATGGATLGQSSATLTITDDEVGTTFTPSETIQDISPTVTFDKYGYATITNVPDIPSGYKLIYAVDFVDCRDYTSLADVKKIFGTTTPLSGGSAWYIDNDDNSYKARGTYSEGSTIDIRSGHKSLLLTVVHYEPYGMTGNQDWIYGAYLCAIPQKITYNLNGGNIDGDTSAKTEYLLSGDTLATTFNAPTKEGSLFKGWYTAGTGGSKVTSATGSSATYYAQWESKLPVNNTAGAATVVYGGTEIDLTAVSGLFTVDSSAGAQTFTIEGGTGAGTISGNLLTVTEAGTIEIGLTTAETSTHQAGAKITATITVDKGTQDAPVGLGKTDAGSYGGSDGKITGLIPNRLYEYKKDGGAYTAVTANTSGEITGLSAGTYVVRFAGNALYHAGSDSAEIIIGQASQSGVLAFSNAAYTIGEDGGSVTITVTRTGGSDGAVSVDYATSDGTATAGSDYTAASGTLSFADGDASSKSFTITVNQDDILEGNETVNLTLSGAAGGAALGRSTATLTITDDEAAQTGAPTIESAVAGNRQVTVAWSEVPDSVSYNIYSSITSGTYTTPAETVTGAVYSCDIVGLDNGTTYYFVVTAVGPGGESAYSNEVSATPRTVPGAPTNVTATAGNGKAVISFTAPADNGGSSITGYTVTSSPGHIVVAGTGTTITVTGLSNGTTYTFTVRAANAAGTGPASVASNAVTPYSPSSGDDRESSTHTESSTPAVPTKPADTGVEILVNGKTETAATATTTKVGDKTVTTVVVDDKKIEEKLQQEGNHAVITIPVQNAADVVVGSLNAQTVKNMENKEAVLEIKTPNITYVLPAQQINIDNVSSQIGSAVALKDITVNIKIAAASEDTVKIAEDTANKNSYQIVVKPVDFEITCTAAGKSVLVEKFNGYVERIITIPEGVDPGKITTGIVLNADGSFSHVPTEVFIKDGRWYARLNSLTNSVYSVIWNPVTVAAVENHWSREAVNDMASRLVVNNPESFTPDGYITRGEFAEYITKALGLYRTKVAKAGRFSDVAASDELGDAITIATEYGIITGYTDGTFRPYAKITREEAMVMYARAMDIVKLSGVNNNRIESYKDKNQVSSWAYSYVKKTLSAGVFNGRTAETIAPKSTFTYAEAATSVRNLLIEAKLINK